MSITSERAGKLHQRRQPTFAELYLPKLVTVMVVGREIEGAVVIGQIVQAIGSILVLVDDSRLGNGDSVALVQYLKHPQREVERPIDIRQILGLVVVVKLH